MSCSPFALVSVLVESSVLASLSASADEDCDVLVPVMSSSALLAADCMAKVMTMANTDSTAATMDRALPRFLPRNVPTMATIANTAPTSPKIAAMLLMIGMKLSTKPSAPNTTPTMPHTVVPCGAGDGMIGAGLIPFGAAGPPLGIGALLNSLMIFFFLLEVVGTLSSLRDRLRSRYWTKVHSCLHFGARGLRHHAR